MSVPIGIDTADLTASHAAGRGENASAKPVFENLMLRVEGGRIAVIVGPSGAGKTTLLNCVAGLHPVDNRNVALALYSARGAIEHGRDKSLSAVDRRRIGVAFQQSNLWSHLSVRENLVHPQMKLGGRSRSAATEWASHLLAQLALSDHAGKPASSLSGGQKQRVALARALCLNPDVVLFDEITASQDPENVQRIFDLIRGYIADSGATALTVSHDMSFVRRIAESVAFLSNGVIRMKATPDIFFNDCDDLVVQRFLQAF